MARKIIGFFIFLTISFSTLAREGMWLPVLLDRNMEEMQQMGFKLSTKDIYDVNHSSLKDAVVLFGRGCTGEIISNDGLMITNHHCGYGQIQAHSSLEHDYLTNGFWAMSRAEELPNSGLSVSILVEMRDVTNEILAGIDTLITDYAISDQIDANSAIVVDEATDGTHYKGKVKSFYNRNQYFLLIYEQFDDVRLVGAPPSAIGKFGGDTDNWMWPRHTGDFSMFRIYADSTNQPAAYSPNNIPYHPKKFLSINIQGIEEGDFAMVFGYPASTQQNLHSAAVKQIIEQRDPDRIAVRDIKLEIMRHAMEADRGTRIKYSAKYASTSNAWKKWQGEINGLNRLDAVNVKLQREEEFDKWVKNDSKRKYNYGNVLAEFERLYNEIAPYQKAKDYYDEVVTRGTDAIKIYEHFNSISAKSKINKASEQEYLDQYFKDYDAAVDGEIFAAIFTKMKQDISDSLLPSSFNILFGKKEAKAVLEKLYSKSILSNPIAMQKLIATESAVKISKAVKKDKLAQLFSAFNQAYDDKIAAEFNRLTRIINQNQKSYVAGLMEMQTDEMIFPDANQTLRISYGKVEGFSPADGVEYKHYTTLDGIIEKDNPEIYDYDVPDHLKELYLKKDYGNYANASGELPVCFTASNHTTGGNSGSPVLDKNGYLIGINFDRCWEGTMSDIMFDPDKCRNISLDMRYMLFLIDKFAGASYLLDEMTIIK